MPPANNDYESGTDRQETWRSAMRDRTTKALKPEYPETGFTTTATLDRRGSGHRNNIPEPRTEMISGIPIPARSQHRPMQPETQARFEVTPDHEGKSANRAVEVIPVPAGLLARRLRGRLWCQKRAGIPHRGRSLKI